MHMERVRHLGQCQYKVTLPAMRRSNPFRHASHRYAFLLNHILKSFRDLWISTILAQPTVSALLLWMKESSVGGDLTLPDHTPIASVQSFRISLYIERHITLALPVPMDMY